MVAYIKGGMQAKGIWKQDPEANILDERDKNEEWRRLHNEELHSLYHSPNIEDRNYWRALVNAELNLWVP